MLPSLVALLQPSKYGVPTYSITLQSTSCTIVLLNMVWTRPESIILTRWYCNNAFQYWAIYILLELHIFNTAIHNSVSQTCVFMYCTYTSFWITQWVGIWKKCFASKKAKNKSFLKFSFVKVSAAGWWKYLKRIVDFTNLRISWTHERCTNFPCLNPVWKLPL